ncbi:MAG: UDP-2,3-diacylglucosamine diphosphatase [Dokdonella sp.]|uniref:UDP-2,3-diacylglucosamine diphosphatase n=1 Tax=Dokdonella sp. TaxID=2291710 RepID=UPI00326500F5
MTRLPFRSVFVSDVHLGLADCQAGYLLDFLRSMQCERLYLVGDIIDFENMAKRPFWHASHTAIVAEILAIAARGTRVVYIPGNHDAALRRLAGQRIAGIEIALDAVHVGADGRRYRVSHGDEHDGESSTPAWLVTLGDALQGFVCGMNRRCNRLLRACGVHYRPLSIHIKTRIGSALRFIRDFERRVADRARADGFDGHICGHIHYARMHQDEHVLYLNDGDWVEHCTTLVEHADGAMELLHWTERRIALGHSAAVVAVPLPLASAA